MREMEEIEFEQPIISYWEKMIHIPLSEVSIAFITLILTVMGILTPIQSTALLLFTSIPIIVAFLLYMSGRGSISKYLHLPIIIFIAAYIIFLIPNIYLGNITSFGAVAGTFYDFFVAFALSFSSIIITYISLKILFKKGWERTEGKKYRILTTILLSTFIPIILILLLNWMGQILFGGKK